VYVLSRVGKPYDVVTGVRLRLAIIFIDKGIKELVEMLRVEITPITLPP
jgi:hypothetical protein